MSAGYFLVCMDCNMGVDLSKAVEITYKQRDRSTFGFQTFGYMKDGNWELDEQGCAEVQHFLMLHRVHKLRVLPEGSDKYAGGRDVPGGFPVDEDDYDPNYNLLTFFNKDPKDPHPDEEIDELPIEVIDEMKRI